MNDFLCSPVALTPPDGEAKFQPFPLHQSSAQPQSSRRLLPTRAATRRGQSVSSANAGSSSSTYLPTPDAAPVAGHSRGLHHRPREASPTAAGCLYEEAKLTLRYLTAGTFSFTAQFSALLTPALSVSRDPSLSGPVLPAAPCPETVTQLLAAAMLRECRSRLDGLCGTLPVHGHDRSVPAAVGGGVAGR